MLILSVFRGHFWPYLGQKVTFWAIWSFCFNFNVNYLDSLLPITFALLWGLAKPYLTGLRSKLVCFCKKTKVHRLIFNTYHTNGFNIPDLQPNYEYQYGMQQHLKLNVITLIQLYINTTRTLKYPESSLNLFVVGKVYTFKRNHCKVKLW